jgi:hypothetical protein
MKKAMGIMVLLTGLVGLALAGCGGKNPPAFSTLSAEPGNAAGAVKRPLGGSAGTDPVRIQAALSSEGRNFATLGGGIQTITTKFGSRRYAPITVQAGVPLRWTIQVDPGNLNGCNNAMVIRKYNIRQKLKVGEVVVEFTPTETGTIPYSCWMGMIRSTITVVDNLAAPDSGSKI